MAPTIKCLVPVCVAKLHRTDWCIPFRRYFTVQRLRVPPKRREREVVAVQVVFDHESRAQLRALRVRAVERFVLVWSFAGSVTGETASCELRLIPCSVFLLTFKNEFDASRYGLVP